MKLISIFFFFAFLNGAFAEKVEMTLAEINCNDIVESECLVLLETDHSSFILHFDEEVLHEDFLQFKNQKNLNMVIDSEIHHWYHTEDIDWHPFYQKLQRKFPRHIFFYTYSSKAIQLK